MSLLVQPELAEPPPRAPVDEPGTSADEGDADDDDDAHPAVYPLAPGAFAVLHSLSTAHLNGRIAVVQEACTGAQGEVRWRVWLTPEAWLQPDAATKTIKPQNLAVVAPREWAEGATHDRERVENTARHVLDNFVASDAEKVVFPSELSNKTRSRLHGCCQEVNDEAGHDLLASQSYGPTGKRALAVTADRGSRNDGSTAVSAASAAASSSVASASDDLGCMRFDEVCELLERLEAIPDCNSIGETIKNAAEKRKQRATQFWSWPPRAPRHTRANLFSVVRLLIPFHDLRRYGVSIEQLARWSALALGLGAEPAKRFGREWQLDARERSETGDLSLILEAMWGRRTASGITAAPLTVASVNAALDATQLGSKQAVVRELMMAARPREVKWLVRIICRDVKIGARPRQPVPQRGEYPKIILDGYCRAQGRVGTPRGGNPPRMYSLLRYQNHLQHVCAVAEGRQLPTAYPPPIALFRHVRAQLSSPLLDLARAAEVLGTTDAYVETKFDGFRFQMHWRAGPGGDGDGGGGGGGGGGDGTMRCFYRSGVECTADMADLLPAVRLSLGAEQPLEGARFTWLRRAWEKVQHEQQQQQQQQEQQGGREGRQGRQAGVPPRVTDLILDGELLVYDELETAAGAYDELGSRPGIQAFGTIHWLRQTAAGAPSNYGREDARRHLMVQVYDVLRLNGRQTMDLPLCERRALLEEVGRCLVPIPHYLEVSPAARVDLGSPALPLQAAFDAARAAGEEGLMVKAAGKPYVPNARSHVLKVKVEYIAGLGDTVTLLLLGARAPRRLGSGGSAHRISEFALGARGGADGDGDGVVWLCNTSPLNWSMDVMPPQQWEALWQRLTEDAPGGAGGAGGARGRGGRALMKRLPVDAAPPAWLGGCPTTASTRPHWVLRDPAAAPVVEVLGSRFLRCYAMDMSCDSNTDIPWKLRFPRVTKWAEASAGVVPDTVATFVAKAHTAFASSAAEGAGAEVAARARKEVAQHNPSMAISWARQPPPPLPLPPPRQPPSWEEAIRGKGSQPPTPREGGATTFSRAARTPPSAERAAKQQQPRPTSPAPAEQDWQTGESGDNMPQWLAEKEERVAKRRKT